MAEFSPEYGTKTPAKDSNVPTTIGFVNAAYVGVGA